jgi:hypothetical protein
MLPHKNGGVLMFLNKKIWLGFWSVCFLSGVATASECCDAVKAEEQGFPKGPKISFSLPERLKIRELKLPEPTVGLEEDLAGVMLSNCVLSE